MLCDKLEGLQENLIFMRTKIDSFASRLTFSHLLVKTEKQKGMSHRADAMVHEWDVSWRAMGKKSCKLSTARTIP